VERIGHLSATFDQAENLCSARFGGIVALEHEGTGALGHYKAVAIL
jgi:hypothetical protein